MTDRSSLPTSSKGRRARRFPEGPSARLARLLPIACMLAIGLLAVSAEARIYKYVDRHGESHFTDSLQQVPLEYRSQVRDLSPELADMDGFRVAGGVAGGDDFEEAGFGSVEGLPDLADLEAEASEGKEMLAGLLESFGFGLILIALLAIPALYVVSALIFKLSCRIAGEEPPGLGRACGILLAQGFAGGAVNGIIGGIAMAMGVDESASVAASLAVPGAASIISWMVSAAILASMMSYGFMKSMMIGCLHTLLVVVMIGGPIAALFGLGLLLG